MSDCACTVDIDVCDDGTFYPISYCSMHDAAPDLLAACSYPRFGDTAGLLLKAAEEMERNAGEGWTSLYARHFRNAAQQMREAVTKAKDAPVNNSNEQLNV